LRPRPRHRSLAHPGGRSLQHHHYHPHLGNLSSRFLHRLSPPSTRPPFPTRRSPDLHLCHYSHALHHRVHAYRHLHYHGDRHRNGRPDPHHQLCLDGGCAPTSLRLRLHQRRHPFDPQGAPGSYRNPAPPAPNSVTTLS